MPNTVFLNLEVDGNNIEGESTMASMDREGSIECVSYYHEVITPREDATGALTGRRQHHPITIVKRIDKSSPLMFKALCLNEPITKGRFRFFRRTGETGTEQHIYTVLIEKGYVAGIREESANVLYGDGESQPLLERVSFVFQDITKTYEIGGATHKDSWAGEA